MRRILGIVPAVAVVLALGPTAAVGRAPSSAADPGGRADRAEAALASVQDLFASGRSRAVAPSAASHRDATMALRDLAALKGSLSPAGRVVADRFLARPTDGAADPLGNGYEPGTPVSTSCRTHVCVHYVKTTDDAVDTSDTNPNNGTPDYVDLVLDTLEHVHTTYRAAGYRAPLSDLSSSNDGGNALTDVYLTDIGDSHLYGYCTTDDPHSSQPGYKYYAMSAYCVLDNDYVASQFPNQTPTKNLQVTAAHEYFHAVQFAYDYLEDYWLMEGTAVWAEDEVYNDINDNRQYLLQSPLSDPEIPLDSAAQLHEYGAWIFFRHLSERYRTAVGGLPTIVRDIWRRADGSSAGLDMYSAQAVRRTLQARGTTFPAAFARFGAVNRHPGVSYDEGSAYSPAPLFTSWGLTTTRRSTYWRSVTLNHMANETVRFRPGSTLAASTWRLRLNLDLPTTSRGSAATVQVYLKNGSIQVWPITLNTDGDANRSFLFSVGSVRFVEVTLTNASTRFLCWQGTTWSCSGKALDNHQVFDYRATVFHS